MRTPELGELIIVSGIQSNGATEHPAIITRVWNNENPFVVNCKVFLDNGDILDRPSTPCWKNKESMKYDVAVMPPICRIGRSIETRGSRRRRMDKESLAREEINYKVVAYCVCAVLMSPLIVLGLFETFWSK